MLADWFFCSCLRLSPPQVHAYLDCVQALTDPLASSGLVSAAIMELAEADAPLQLRALPAVLATLRTRSEPAVVAARELFHEQVAAMTHHGAEVRAALSVAAAPATDLPAQLAPLLEIHASKPLPPAEAVGDPYHDLVDRADEVVTVALVHHLVQLNPDAGRRLLEQDEEFAALLRRWAESGHGRLAALLAAEVLGGIDAEDRDEIASVLMRAVGPHRTPGAGCAGDPGPDLVPAGHRSRAHPRDPGGRSGHGRAADLSGHRGRPACRRRRPGSCPQPPGRAWRAA